MGTKNSNLSNPRIGHLLAYSSLGLIGLLIITLLFPTTFSTADALENSTASAETRIAVNASPTVAISLDTALSLDLVPASHGTFGVTSTRLGISTNNEEGYQIFLTTSNGKSELENIDASKTGPEYKISSILHDTVGSEFMNNTWGYSLSKETIDASSTYSAVPTTTQPVLNVSTPSLGGEDVYHLGFGTHISTSLPAGQYSNSVVVSVVANPITITNLSQLVYMQDIQPEFCANAAEGTTKQLYDTRDGHKYWVAKLRDGNCWMTQNLAFDLKQGDVLTPYDTDIATSWTVPRSTEMTVPEKSAEDPTVTRSWNFGKTVLKNPTASTLCLQDLPASLQGAEYKQDGWNSVFYGYRPVEVCSHQYGDVSDLVSGFTATETTSISEDGQQYDAHYLIGNFYTWMAATAGTGAAANDANVNNANAATDPSKLVDATGSICPKGWQLPTSGRSLSESTGWPFDREKSFYRLLRAYGYPETGSVSTNVDNRWTEWVFEEGKRPGNVFTALTGTGKTRADYAPIYYVRSGNINFVHGALRSAGFNGNYWSSTAFPVDSDLAYYLYFETNNIYPVNRAAEYAGLSVRCVAR